MARIVLGVGGGIAAYKVPSVLRGLRAAGHCVDVIPTPASLQFVGATTWAALSGKTVASGVFDAGPGHVCLGQGADLAVVAPATADLMARYAAGLADDLLTATLLATSAPTILFPAMHTQMWNAPATKENVATLRRRGVRVVEPDSGPLAGNDTGPGRMPEPDAIVEAVLAALAAPGRPAVVGRGVGATTAGSTPDRVDVDGRGVGDLSGLVVAISAGGTQEPIDPVRYLGNRSSGKQGVALAEEAAALGARVRLVGANLQVPVPAGIERTDVSCAEELRQAMAQASRGAAIVVMAAAVADFRPAAPLNSKIKRTGRDGFVLELTPTPDILRELVAAREPDQLVVGFAAETGDGTSDPLSLGQVKARAKGTDLTVVNDVSGGRAFGCDENAVWILDAAGELVGEGRGSKREVARAIMSVVACRLPHHD